MHLLGTSSRIKPISEISSPRHEKERDPELFLPKSLRKVILLCRLKRSEQFSAFFKNVTQALLLNHASIVICVCRDGLWGKPQMRPLLLAFRGFQRC